LLHKAYAQLAEKGMKYVASHQDDNTTLRRLTQGKSFLALVDQKIVGTISVYGPQPDSKAPYYRENGVYHFGQFTVDPHYQGKGIGKLLFLAVETYCKNQNAKILALDTSEKASDLISMYERWGFRIIGKVKWDITNYTSVLMSKQP
jgi:GNAT superfamily N-acetyltransferase